MRVFIEAVRGLEEALRMTLKFVVIEIASRSQERP
jgi:hypothetical protein